MDAYERLEAELDPQRTEVEVVLELLTLRVEETLEATRTEVETFQASDHAVRSRRRRGSGNLGGDGVNLDLLRATASRGTRALDGELGQIPFPWPLPVAAICRRDASDAVARTRAPIRCDAARPVPTLG